MHFSRKPLGRFSFPCWRGFWTCDITRSWVIWCHAFKMTFRHCTQSWKQSFWGWPLKCGHDVTFRRSSSDKRLSKPPYYVYKNSYYLLLKRLTHLPFCVTASRVFSIKWWISWSSWRDNIIELIQGSIIASLPTPLCHFPVENAPVTGVNCDQAKVVYSTKRRV